MSNKITAKFGADVSEVEAKMVQATRATKAYERAVKAVDGVSPMSKLTRDAPKAIAQIKGLAGAFGGAAAAAGLVPGLGVAAIGVAALSFGVKKIREYYQEAADQAKRIAEYAEREMRAKLAWVDVGRSAAQKQAREDEELSKKRTRLAELEAAQKKTIDVRDRRGNRTGETREVAVELTGEQREEMAKLRAEIAEAETKKRADQLKTEEERSKAEAKRKADEEDRALKEGRATLAQITAIQERRKWEAMTDAEKVARLEKEIAMRKADREQTMANTLALLQAEEKLKEVREKQAKTAQDMEDAVADLIGELDDQRQKNHEEEMKRTEKERDAKLKAIEDEKKAMQAKTEGALGGIGLTKGEDGKLRRGNVIVSEEDAARTLADRARNAGFEAKSRAGQIKGAGKVGESGQAKTQEAAILEKIESYLRPSEI
jgi:hypothetical protein